MVLVQTGRTRRSGLIISADGLVLTSAAVVREAETAEVVVRGVGAFRSLVLGRDEIADLAVLRIPTAGDLPFEELVTPQSIGPGLIVTAVGFPAEAVLGNLSMVTTGNTVSVRTFNGVPYIQTNVSLDPGYGGGPLVNNLGHVIGINTTETEAILGGTIARLGLATHLTDVLRRLERLEAGAHFFRPTPPTSLLPPGSIAPIPPFPNLFTGDVTIDGEPAPAGTQVYARVGRYVSEWKVTQDGRYPIITVQPPEGTGYEGERVIFYVNGIPQDPGLVYDPQQDDPIIEVDLDLLTAPAS